MAAMPLTSGAISGAFCSASMMLVSGPTTTRTISPGALRTCSMMKSAAGSASARLAVKPSPHLH